MLLQVSILGSKEGLEVNDEVLDMLGDDVAGAVGALVGLLEGLAVGADVVGVGVKTATHCLYH